MWRSEFKSKNSNQNVEAVSDLALLHVAWQCLVLCGVGLWRWALVGIGAHGLSKWFFFKVGKIHGIVLWPVAWLKFCDRWLGCSFVIRGLVEFCDWWLGCVV